MPDDQNAPFYFFTPGFSHFRGSNILPDEIIVREKILTCVEISLFPIQS